MKLVKTVGKVGPLSAGIANLVVYEPRIAGDHLSTLTGTSHKGKQGREKERN